MAAEKGGLAVLDLGVGGGKARNLQVEYGAVGLDHVGLEADDLRHAGAEDQVGLAILVDQHSRIDRFGAGIGVARLVDEGVGAGVDKRSFGFAADRHADLVAADRSVEIIAAIAVCGFGRPGLGVGAGPFKDADRQEGAHVLPVGQILRAEKPPVGRIPVRAGIVLVIGGVEIDLSAEDMGGRVGVEALRDGLGGMGRGRHEGGDQGCGQAAEQIHGRGLRFKVRGVGCVWSGRQARPGPGRWRSTGRI